jgi:hypothetical protein
MRNGRGGTTKYSKSTMSLRRREVSGDRQIGQSDGVGSD